MEKELRSLTDEELKGLGNRLGVGLRYFDDFGRELDREYVIQKLLASMPKRYTVTYKNMKSNMVENKVVRAKNEVPCIPCNK